MHFNVYEIKIKIYLLQNVHIKNVLEKISNFIDISFNISKEFQEFHTRNMFKNYCFSGFYNSKVKNEILLKDNVYSFSIRTVNKNLAEHFKKELPNTESIYMKGLTSNEIIIYKKYLEELNSLTPVFTEMKNSKRYWQNTNNVEDFINMLNTNIIKRYNTFTASDISIDEKIFTGVSFLKKKPSVVMYKSKNFLTDKIKVFLESSDIAQNIGYFAIGTGLMHANSRGFGFCNYKFYKDGNKLC